MISRLKVNVFIAVVAILDLIILCGLVSLFLVGEHHKKVYELFWVIAGVETIYFIYVYIVFGLWIIKRHLPEVHEFVNPGYVKILSRAKPELLMEAHYLLTYSLSSGMVWYNRRCFGDFDFQDLPVNLLYPLKVFFYLFCIGSGFLVVSSLLTGVVELFE